MSLTDTSANLPGDDGGMLDPTWIIRPSSSYSDVSFIPVLVPGLLDWLVEFTVYMYIWNTLCFSDI